MYTTRKPDELAELLGLSVKQEELLPTSSTLEDAWVREQGDVKEGENQENVFASENTEGPCDLEALGGGEEVEEERVKESELNSKTIEESELENKKVKESELENKRSNDHENKAKLSSSDLNKIHSTDFFDAFLGENVEESGDKREMTIEKGKDEGVLVTNFEKKMFSRRRCHGYRVKKEGRTEAEVDGQYKIESESVGNGLQKNTLWCDAIVNMQVLVLVIQLLKNTVLSIVRVFLTIYFLKKAKSEGKCLNFRAIKFIDAAASPPTQRKQKDRFQNMHFLQDLYLTVISIL